MIRRHQPLLGAPGHVHVLAGVAAIVLPHRPGDVFEASPVRWRLADVPVLSVLGALSIAGRAVIEHACLSDPNSGIWLGAPTMLLVDVAVFLSGFVFYAAVRALRRGQGIDLRLTFAEIPPE